MTERRPHWSNDLIVAVGDAIEHADPTVYPTVGMVNDVIAAVEDWQATQVRELEVTVCECPPKAAIKVCPATNTLLGKPIECDRGVGHNGPHMTRESWQWFDAPEGGDA